MTFSHFVLFFWLDLNSHSFSFSFVLASLHPTLHTFYAFTIKASGLPDLKEGRTSDSVLIASHSGPGAIEPRWLRGRCDGVDSAELVSD